jgi:hypothetical protein
VAKVDPSAALARALSPLTNPHNPPRNMSCSSCHKSMANSSCRCVTRPCPARLGRTPSGWGVLEGWAGWAGWAADWGSRTLLTLSRSRTTEAPHPTLGRRPRPRSNSLALLPIGPSMIREAGPDAERNKEGGGGGGRQSSTGHVRCGRRRLPWGGASTYAPARLHAHTDSCEQAN